MKDYFLKLIHTFEEFETLLALDEKYRLYYLKEAVRDESGRPCLNFHEVALQLANTMIVQRIIIPYVTIMK